MDKKTITYGVRYISDSGAMELAFIKASSEDDAKAKYKKRHPHQVLKTFPAQF